MRTVRAEWNPKKGFHIKESGVPNVIKGIEETDWSEVQSAALTFRTKEGKIETFTDGKSGLEIAGLASLLNHDAMRLFEDDDGKGDGDNE